MFLLKSENNLIKRILSATDGNEQDLLKPKGISRGYMGYIYKMVSQIKENNLQSLLPPEWNHYFSQLPSSKLCQQHEPDISIEELEKGEDGDTEMDIMMYPLPDELLNSTGFPLELFWDIGIHESLLQTEIGAASNHQLQRLKQVEDGFNQMIDKLVHSRI